MIWSCEKERQNTVMEIAVAPDGVCWIGAGRDCDRVAVNGKSIVITARLDHERVRRLARCVVCSLNAGSRYAGCVFVLDDLEMPGVIQDESVAADPTVCLREMENNSIERAQGSC